MGDRGDITEFCTDGSLFAHSNKDGCLRLWNTESSNLSQEYIPTSHLTATTTCLAWRSPRCKGSEDVVEAPGADLLALGTCTGSLLVYCSRQGRVQRQWEGRHTGAVRRVVWSGSRRLLSCGDDGHVVQSSLKSDKITLKFRAARSPVLSMCLLADGDSLLTGSRTVSWWRLKSQTLVRTFSGHSGEVTLLRAVPTAHPSSQYFISGSATERTISAWLLCEGDGEQQNTASACFSLLAEPRHVHVTDTPTDDSDGGGALLTVTTTTGVVHVFSTRLNGVSRKPVKPRLTLQLVSETEPAQPLPLLASRLHSPQANDTIVLSVCYGSLLLPTFETMRFDSDTPSSQCLVRADRAVKLLSARAAPAGDGMCRVPAESARVSQLAPGFMTQSTRKRQLSHVDTDDATLPMERRLSSLSLKHRRVAVASREQARAGGMAQLLVQGLQGNDRQMLRTVLNNGDERVIRDTVNALPTDTLLPLIAKLAHLLRFSDDGRVCMKWLRAIMERHAAFFLAQPDLQSVFAPIYSSLQARVRHLPRLLQLRGRLQLLSAQLDSHGQSGHSEQVGGGEEVWDSSAALHYQDDSTDDEHFGLPSSGDGNAADDIGDFDDDEALGDETDDDGDGAFGDGIDGADEDSEVSDEEMSEGDEESHDEGDENGFDDGDLSD